MVFKTCPYCKTEWTDFIDFLDDKNLVVTGYHAIPEKPEDGIIVLQHDCPECGGSIGVRVKKVADAYDLTHFEESLYGTNACNNHCPTFNDIEACDNNCSMRWVRDLVQLMRNRVPPPGPTPATY